MVSSSKALALPATLLLIFIAASTAAQLSTTFYSTSCPQLFHTIKSKVETAISKEPRMGASLLRLFFHDCFVNGCDGSILLEDTANFTGEQHARPNNNSVRGFGVVAKVKAAVEKVCPGVVSCADVLAVVTRDSVVILGGASWKVKLGRRDATSASLSAANNDIPPPTSNLSSLISKFSAKGLTVEDMVALSGAHTIGQARCTTFRARIYNDTNIDAHFAKKRRSNCPRVAGSGDNRLAPEDLRTPVTFDNKYYRNLVHRRGLLHSDQQLFNNGSTDSQVMTYAASERRFYLDFAAAMIKMGDISPLIGSKGEIRKKCRRVN